MGKSWDRLWEDASQKVLSPGAVGAGFTTGGSDRFANSQLPSFTGSEPNWVCQNCGGTKRGKVRKGFFPCECEEPDFAGAEGYLSGKMQQMQRWHEGWLREVFRVLKPGGTAKVFAATRTMHRLAAAMETAGFILEPETSLEGWSYASGFPKSLNVGKNVDKLVLAQRETKVLEALRQKGFDKVVWSTDHE